MSDNIDQAKDAVGNAANEVGNEAGKLKDKIGGLFNRTVNSKQVASSEVHAADATRQSFPTPAPVVIDAGTATNTPTITHKGTKMKVVVTVSSSGPLTNDVAIAKVKEVLEKTLAQPTPSGLTGKVEKIEVE